MDTNRFLLLYVAIVGIILILSVITKRKNKDYYDRLDKKEHPLRFLYPAAALVCAAGRTLFRLRPNRNMIAKMKRLHVKENVAEEAFLHTVKKTALIMTILLCSSCLGALLCIADMQTERVEQLDRNEYGKGEAVYDLDVVYDGQDETVQLAVEEQKYTESEIKEKFEQYSEEVRKVMLGENPSAEQVSKPLNLISEYKDIAIAWEIEDTDIVDYNGKISPSVKNTDKILLNLYATFSLDEIKQVYTMPVVVTGESPGKTELLVNDILERIREENSVYEQEVKLPDEIDGKKITFHQSKEHNEFVFLLLALIAALVILFGYDRKLDQQIRKRNEEMMLDFSEIVSKLSLLYEAGSSISNAWAKIVEDHERKYPGKERFAYKEMKMVMEKIRSGMSEKEAYAEFGRRCGLHPYIKLGNILEQNLSKGTKGMKLLLKQEVSESFEERKRIARKRGEEASTKLLFPMVLMLLVVIIIIALPALMSMQL